MDVSEIIPSLIRIKIHVIRNLLISCSSISIGVFKYKEHVSKTGNSSVSNKILEWYQRLQELAKDDILKRESSYDNQSNNIIMFNTVRIRLPLLPLLCF